jgi:hypothetical protein
MVRESFESYVGFVSKVKKRQRQNLQPRLNIIKKNYRNTKSTNQNEYFPKKKSMFISSKVKKNEKIVCRLHDEIYNRGLKPKLGLQTLTCKRGNSNLK